MQNQALTTSQATMEGALRAVRLDRAELQKEIDRLRARLSQSASHGANRRQGRSGAAAIDCAAGTRNRARPSKRPMKTSRSPARS